MVAAGAALGIGTIADLASGRFAFGNNSETMHTPQPRRILIVNGDAKARDSVREILEQDHYWIETAETATEALEKTRLEKISVVILDQDVSDLSVEQLIPGIQQLAPEAAVIYVSDSVDGAVAAMRLGAANYLLKPINPGVLLADLVSIVEHQRAKSELRDQYVRMQAVVNSAIEGIITIDETGVIESFNPAAENMFGYTADEAIGKNISEMMPDPYSSEHHLYLSNFRRTGIRKIIGTGREVVAQRQDGSTFPIHLSVSEVLLEDRRLFTGMVRDITAIKQAEERLLQSERLAGIGQAMAALAHESRNALQRSQAGLEMLERRIENQPEATKLIKRIQRAQDDLHQLYEDVREYAAPIRVNPEHTAISDIVRHAWHDLALAREGRNAALTETGDDPYCQGDKFGLRLVFRNILENAIAATTEEPRIRVEYGETDFVGQPAVRICICDNGPGLTADAQQQIFHEFYTTKTRGTGLGMAICKRIIVAHGGLIEAENRPPSGACITIILPRSQS